MEIKNYKPITNAGCLKGTFTLSMTTELGEGQIDCAYFAKEPTAKWINYAGKEYTTKEGKRKNWNQCRWPQVNLAELTSRVLKMLAPLIDGVQPVTDDALPF